MQEKELFTVVVGLLIICLYPSDDVTLSNAPPFVLHHFEHLTFKSPVRREQVGISLFIRSIRVSKFLEKFSNSCWFWLGDW